MVVTAIGLVTLAGCALRVLAARGDLWLDEIWSERLVETVHSYAQIVLALPHDNNHVLNSLWLKFVGADAPPWLVRLPAIVFGTLCAPVAARIGWRVGPHAALVAATIFALDYAFVHFGSEARGYAGLILAILVALDALEPMLDGNAIDRNLLAFALAVAFGLFSHLMMLEATGLLCAVALLRIVQAGGWRPAAALRALPILLAAVAGALPALVCLALSLASGPLHIGLSTPFSWAAQADGLGHLAQAIIGWPHGPLTNNGWSWLVVALGFAVVVALPLVPPHRRPLPLAGILGLPLLHAALHVPNQSYARFHLTSGVILALFAAEIWARLWGRGRAARSLAIIAALGIGAGQGPMLTRFVSTGRGHYHDAVALMTQPGPATFTVFPTVAASETAAVIRWYAHRDHFQTALGAIPNDQLCKTPPDWIVVIHHPGDPADIADASRLQASPCIKQFTVAATFSAYGLSGYDWTIWRRITSSR